MSAERSHPDETAMDECFAIAARIATRYLRDLEQHPVWKPMQPAERSRILETPLQAESLSSDFVLREIEEAIMPFPFGNGSVRFFAYINPPPEPIAVAADLLAAAMNPSCAGGDHAAMYVESAVVRWIAELAGYPAQFGLLTSGGSHATLTALGAARSELLTRAGYDVRARGLWGAPMLYAYFSDQGHSSIVKALRALGFGEAQLRRVPVDEQFRMDTAALRRALDDDQLANAGAIVIGSVGTTNTGAIDPLAELGDICAHYGAWLHLDAAYGAFGRLDASVAALFDGVERADSLTVDPHKWLGIPADCGCLLVRDAGALRRTYSLVPEYLPTSNREVLPWRSEYGLEQTRPFRALRAWAGLRSLGRDAIAARVETHNRLIRNLALLVADHNDFEVMHAPVLSILCIRYAPAGVSAEHCDTLNTRLVDLVQRNGRFYVTSTRLRGRTVVRICTVHRETVQEHVVGLFEELGRIAATL
jgi:aromatic-L-amino-acid decarboxylase